MKAIVRNTYGTPEVLHMEEVDKPIPNDDQVLLKVRAASINKSDWYELTAPVLFRLIAGGLLKPKNKILGSDVAGVVESVGKNIKEFKAGDEVFGSSLWGFAEYACAREVRLAPKPTNSSFEESAAIPIAAITALQGLRKGKIQPGQKVLVDGASGGVGTFAVQIAKSFGAEVTAVCSTGNLENARSLGADNVVDYTKDDFTKGGQTYDLVFGANAHRSILDYRRVLAPRGTYMMAGGSIRLLVQVLLLGPLLSRIGGRKMGSMGIAKLNKEDLLFLRGLLEAGKLRPLIDKRFPLGQTAEAMRYLGEGHAKGKVVIYIE